MAEGFALKNLRIKNFRNHSDTNISLNFQLVFFIGKNGVGKTSLLEAISLASILKSFRARSPKDIISWQQKLYTINLTYQDGQKNHNIHIGYHRDKNQSGRSLIFDGKKIKRISDFIGRLQTVFFSQNDIHIVDTTPLARRQFFDMLLSGLYSDYLRNLQEYQKILRIRSIILKQNTTQNPNLTFFKSLDKQIAQKGSFLQKYRETFFQEIQELFNKYVRLISGNTEDWTLYYKPSVKEGISSEKYFKILQENLLNDLKWKKTSVGIHRDQIKFYLKHPHHNELELREVASQGQKRTVALALKMAQYTYTKQKIQKTPVLLIDDILNELDVLRRGYFISFLNEAGQALITTTDLFGMEKFIQNKKEHVSICIYNIKNQEDKVSIEPELI